MAGSCYQSENSLNQAVQWYRKAGEEGQKYLFGIGQFAFLTEQYEGAESILTGIDSDESRELLYRIAEKKVEEKDLEAGTLGDVTGHDGFCFLFFFP